MVTPHGAYNGSFFLAPAVCREDVRGLSGAVPHTWGATRFNACLRGVCRWSTVGHIPVLSLSRGLPGGRVWVVLGGPTYVGA